MSASLCPRLRPLEIFPIAQESARQPMFAVRDPQGYSQTVALPYPAALLATLMDGRRELSEIQREFRLQAGGPVALADLNGLIEQLDEALLLDTPRFRAHLRAEIEIYRNNPVRPATHAGGAYAGEPDELREQLAELFTCEAGPGAPDWSQTDSSQNRLCGVLSPHIDLHRGGPAFAWAYKKLVEENAADLFIIFGTAHSGMKNLFSVSRKNFDTPLGPAETDQAFIDSLQSHLEQQPDRGSLELFDDEMAHRNEHSIEFQAVFLQYLLGGRRPFRIVPILTGSFHEFVEDRTQPGEAGEIHAFVTALRAAVADYPGKVAFISGGDLAHVGQRFGDEWLLDQPRLADQSDDDHQLLAAACKADAVQFFDHVAAQQDQRRICGLAPTYTMLQVMQPTRGELLKYDQAVEEDGSACVSFASVAFYA